MTKKHTITYALLALTCGLAYPGGRSIMIHQMSYGYIIISNLTLNYVFLFMIAGIVSPRIAPKLSFLRRFKKATASAIVMIVLVSALLIVLALAGMPMRFTK